MNILPGGKIIFSIILGGAEIAIEQHGLTGGLITVKMSGALFATALSQCMLKAWVTTFNAKQPTGVVLTISTTDESSPTSLIPKIINSLATPFGFHPWASPIELSWIRIVFLKDVESWLPVMSLVFTMLFVGTMDTLVSVPAASAGLTIWKNEYGDDIVNANTIKVNAKEVLKILMDVFRFLVPDLDF